MARNDGIYRLSLTGLPRLGRPLISAVDLGDKADVATGLAVDSSHIYWFDPRLNAIGRASLNGGHVQRRFITADHNTDSIAVDTAHIYWSTNTGVGRANLDGTSVNPRFIPTGRDSNAQASSVAVDQSHIYFGGTSATVGRANLDGSQVTQQFVQAYGDVSSVAVRSANLYFAGWDGADQICGFIGIQPLDGSPRRGIGLNQCGPLAPLSLAVGASHVYFTDAASNPGYSLFRTNLDLSHRQKLLGGPNLAVAIDALTFPDTAITSAVINRSQHTARFRFTSSQSGTVFECALDRQRFTKCGSPRTYSGLKQGRHVFRVRAKTPIAADPSPATKRFTT